MSARDGGPRPDPDGARRPHRPCRPVARDYRRRRPAAGDPALLDLLVDRLEDYKATVVRCGPAEVAATVATALADAGSDRATSSSRPACRPTGGRTARSRTTAAPPSTWPTSPPRSPASPSPSPRPAPSSSTAPRCPGGGALSLLPDRLVCVVEADQVVGSVPEGLARLDPLAPLTLISGPSATSDIELQRVEGVHGPRTLIVVLVA